MKVLQFVFKYKLMMKNEDLNSDATVDDEAESPTHQKQNSRDGSLLRDCWV